MVTTGAVHATRALDGVGDLRADADAHGAPAQVAVQLGAGMRVADALHEGDPRVREVAEPAGVHVPPVHAGDEEDVAADRPPVRSDGFARPPQAVALAAERGRWRRSGERHHRFESVEPPHVVEVVGVLHVPAGQPRVVAVEPDDARESAADLRTAHHPSPAAASGSAGAKPGGGPGGRHGDMPTGAGSGPAFRSFRFRPMSRATLSRSTSAGTTPTPAQVSRPARGWRAVAAAGPHVPRLRRPRRPGGPAGARRCRAASGADGRRRPPQGVILPSGGTGIGACRSAGPPAADVALRGGRPARPRGARTHSRPCRRASCAAAPRRARSRSP